MPGPSRQPMDGRNLTLYPGRFAIVWTCATCTSLRPALIQAFSKLIELRLSRVGASAQQPGSSDLRKARRVVETGAGDLRPRNGQEDARGAFVLLPSPDCHACYAGLRPSPAPGAR